jgi:uncharacterized protein YdbL (DUF1318 family)
MRKILLIAAGLSVVGLGYTKLAVDAYAQGAAGGDVEAATDNRRERRADLYILEQKGVIGENKSGLIQVMPGHEADAAASAMVDKENSDRMLIFNSVAEKNHQPIADIQTMNAKNFQCDVPSGTPIEVPNAQGSAYEWKVK